MTRKQAIKLALEALGRWMQTLAPEANIGAALGSMPYQRKALEKYQELAEASKLIEEMAIEQRRLFE